MKWTLSLLAVPLLYLLSVPWVVRLDYKMSRFSGNLSSYYRPWTLLAQSATMNTLLWDYAIWCDRMAGESEPPSFFIFMIMHPQEQP